jgi:hypothetical protein
LKTSSIWKDSEEQNDRGLSDGFCRIQSQQQKEYIEKGTSQGSHASHSLDPQGLKIGRLANTQGDMQKLLFICPHCSHFETKIESEYQLHVVTKHLGNLDIPT